MKILFQSYAFYPSVGGIESSADLLLRKFVELGHEIRIHTMTPLDNAPEIDLYKVTREPKFSKVIGDLKWADILYQHNPSLRLSWPSSFLKIPTAISIHTWIRRSENERLSLVDRIKRHLISHHTVISNSYATAEHLGFPSTIIENAYDDSQFHNQEHNDRQGMVFVGRLVSDKGCITAIEAVAKLSQAGRPLSLTIVGSGPDEDSLKESSSRLGINSLVNFVGRKSPEDVASILNCSRYQLIPSVWAEPFGIVALEGIACGCIPIATNNGGLVDAVGNCGALFPPGDSDMLASKVMELESKPDLVENYLRQRKEHLARHSPDSVAAAYIEAFENTLKCAR